MELFWRHGYEGVSIGDLTEAIGIAPPSLYSAFGSKALLYQETLDHYAEGSGALNLLVLDQKIDLRDAVGAVLAAAIASVSATSRACMVSSGMLACHRNHDALARGLANRRREFERMFREKLTRWIPPAEAASLARFLCTVMQGISVHARDGATRRELEGIADYVADALPPL